MTRGKLKNPRRKTRKDERREATRRALITAAKELFAQYGYNDVSVTEIAREAGVTHSMINVYFGGKPGLLYEIVRENNDLQYAKSQEIAAQNRPALDRLSDLLLFWAETDAADPALLSVMQSYSWVWSVETEAENSEDRARFKEVLENLLRHAQANDEIGPKVEPHAASSAIFAVYTWGLRPAIFEELSPEACCDRIMQQVLALLA